MNVAIVGSRSYTDYNHFVENLFVLTSEWPITSIVSGGAKGADKMAERFADYNNYPVNIILPDWNKYGKGAGFKRNSLIVEACDILIAFWDGKSTGTKDSIDKARKCKKITIIVYI